MPSQAKLSQLFNYDPNTGSLTRRVNAPPAGKAGDVITKSKVSVSGRAETTLKVIWCIAHGEWPPQNIVQINGVQNDWRMSNLELKVT